VSRSLKATFFWFLRHSDLGLEFCHQKNALVDISPLFFNAIRYEPGGGGSGPSFSS
jgi:hypothetical protein